MNSPSPSLKASLATRVSGEGRKDSMSAADFRALTGSKPAAKGKTSKATPAPPTARNIEAIAEVAKVGRYKGQYEGQPARRYVLLNEGQAAELDQCFHRITGTQP